MVAGQLSSIPGAQTLKVPAPFSSALGCPMSMLCRWSLPSLDIASAFDHLDHLAISKFFRLLGPHREAESSYFIMTYSTVLLSMADCEWTQDVDRAYLARFVVQC